MLKFNVFNQKLVRIDKNNPATDSVEYLEAQFVFNTDDWNGKTKSAIFTKGTSSYTVLLDSKGVCKVPFEVLQSNESSKLLGNTDKISVSLVGTYNTVRITTNEVKINLNYSGYTEGQEPSEPTAEMYEQILSAYADAEAKCEETQQAFANTLGLYANAIKGNVSGTTVSADDVSPIEHNLDVWVHSKNLYDSELLAGVYIKGNGTNFALDTTDGSVFKSIKAYLLAGTYTVSFSKDVNIVRLVTESSYDIVGYIKTKKHTFDVKTNGYVGFTFRDSTSISTEWDETTIIQIEKGNEATEYTPYIDPTNTNVTVGNETFTASSNGTIEGIKSTALANGITTEAEGMTIDVNYNKDINVVLNKITDALGIEI